MRSAFVCDPSRRRARTFPQCAGFPRGPSPPPSTAAFTIGPGEQPERASRVAEGRLRGGPHVHPLSAAQDADDGRVRGRERRRRADVHRGGTRRERGPAGPAVRRARRGSCSTSCSSRSGSTARTCSSPTTLKCRPPDNRDPHPNEIEACSGLPAPAGRSDRADRHLHARQLLDEAAARRHDRDLPSARAGGGATDRPSRAVRLYPLYHPAAALYTPSTLEALRADFHRIPDLLALGPPPQPQADIEDVPEFERDPGGATSATTSPADSEQHAAAEHSDSELVERRVHRGWRRS